MNLVRDWVFIAGLLLLGAVIVGTIGEIRADLAIAEQEALTLPAQVLLP